MKLAIVGGHLSPALSVIDALPKDVSVIFFGRKHAFEGDAAQSLEYREITARQIPFFPITTGRLQRKLTKHTLTSLMRFPRGVKQAYLLLHREEPDIILSFGSYVSLPFVLASSTLRIPLIIHEQTLEAGLANRLASRFARKICISWETSGKYFPRDKTVLTGNPIRITKSVQTPNLPRTRLPFVYITGGSAGSHAINASVMGCIEALLDEAMILHQTGNASEFRDFEKLQHIRGALQKEKKARYVLRKFVSPKEVSGLMQRADLVIGRSGINTVSELLYYGKPALLIPLPFSQRQEQRKNAKFLERLGAARILDQEELTSDMLFVSVSEMLKDLSRYRSRAGEKERLRLRGAAANIVRVVLDVSKEARNH